MSDSIRRRMLPRHTVGDDKEYTIGDDKEYVRKSVFNAARRAVDEANPFTKSTIAALLSMDLDVEPVKEVIGLSDGVSPNELQQQLLMGLAETAILHGDEYLAIGYDALAEIDPDDSVSRFQTLTFDQTQVELRKIA